MRHRREQGEGEGEGAYIEAGQALTSIHSSLAAALATAAV